MNLKLYILLIVMLISISTVSATLTVSAIYGSQGIKNYRMTNDTILINVSSNHNVSLNGAQCASGGGQSYYCSVTDNVNTPTASYQLTDDGNESAVAMINVDNSIGTIDYNVTNNSTAQITYTIQDTGFNGNSQCSGLKELDIYDGTSMINTVLLNGTPNICSYTGSSVLSVSDSGNVSIILTVTDNVGNVESTTPQSMMIDLKAPEIANGLVITKSGSSDELDVLSNSANFLVDAYFSVKEDNLVSIKADLSSFNSNSAVQHVYSNFNVPLSNCLMNDTTGYYDCVIRGIPMKLGGSSVTMNVTAKDAFGNVGNALLTKTFTVDNVVPNAVIKTDTCDSKGICYVKNGINTILVELNKDNFNNRYVFFNLPGSTFGINRVQNCTGTECYANVSLTCDNGPVTTGITSLQGFPSQDDAGNPLADYSTTLYCDNTIPEIKNITVSGDIMIQQIISGSTITITTSVHDAETNELTASAFMDKVKNDTEDGACTGISDFNCTWTVTGINAGYYEANVLVNVSDTAGNTESKNVKFKVFGVKSDNETPDNLNIQFNNMMPAEMNRVVLDMATSNNVPFYAYATYTVGVNHGNDVSVLYQLLDISKCIYHTPQGAVNAGVLFQSAKITNPYANIDDVNRIEFLFNTNVDPNILADEFTISCNISARVKVGNYVYNTPQQLQLDIPIRLANSKLCVQGQDCTPGAVFGRKIQDAEDNWLVKAKILGVLNDWIPKLQQICRLGDYIAAGSFVSSVASTAINAVQLGSGLGGVGGNAAGPAMNVNIQLDKLYNGLVCDPKNKASGNCSKGILDEACSYLTCNTADAIGKDPNASHIPDLATFSSDKNFFTEAGSAITRNSNMPDVGNSIVMAAATQCYPAILYNINKYRQTDCNYLYCLKMASYSGTDVSACDKAEYAQTCSIVVGEVFEWPFAVKVKNYMNNLADLTKNLLPLAVASTVKNYILNCQEYINFDTGKVTVPATAQAAAWKIYTCQIPMQIAIFADSTTRSKQAQGFSYPQIPDMCVYAQCVGEQNCKYEPDFWDTLSKMNLPVPTNRTMEYNAQSTKADSYVLMDDIRKLRQYTYFSDPANLPKDATPQQIAALQGISKTDAATIQGTLSKKGLIPHYTGLGSSSTPDASTTSDTNLKLNDVPGTDINSIVSDGTYAGDVYLDDGGSIQSRDDSNTNYNIITYNGKTYVQDNGDPTQVYQVTADWNSVRNSPDAGNIYDASGVPYPVSATPSTTPTIVSTQDKINALDTDINQWKNNPAELSKLVNSEKVTAYTPPTKTQFDSMTPDQKAAFTADQIGWLNQIQGINNQLNNLNNPKIQQQTLSEQQVLKDKRDALAGSLCDKAGGCDSLVKSICGTDTTCTNKYLQDGKLTVDFADNTKMADFQGQVSHAQDIYKATASAEQLGNTVQLAFQFFNAQNLMRWMFTDYWTQKWFGKDFSAYFDFDKYKQSLCNPDNPINIAGEDSTPGSVISCSSGMCRPVLTFAAERTPLEYPNGTKYNLYTIVYYIDAGDLRGYSMSYNLHLTGTSPAGASISIKGYVNNVSLTSFSIQTQRKVFSTPLVLNQLCIDFSDPGFPPQDSLQRKTEYCRDVLANAFDTGSPWNPAQDAQAQGYINQIDQNGNRVLSPNVQVVGNTVPPGFME